MSAEQHAESPRRLVVFRHAKSDWPEGVADHDRPLAARGRRDAPAVGRWLHGTGWSPDHVLCSTAVRARDSWLLAAGELTPAPEMTYEQRVYHGSVPQLVEVLRETPAAAATVVLVGHNPGLQELVLALADNAGDDAVQQVETKFPTAAIAVLTVPGTWVELAPGAATLTDLVVPRG